MTWSSATVFARAFAIPSKSDGYARFMSKFLHMKCLVCNARVDPGEQGYGWAQTFNRSSGSAEGQPHIRLHYVLHDACAHHAAHPDFDFAAVEQAREQAEELVRRSKVES